MSNTRRLLRIPLLAAALVAVMMTIAHAGGTIDLAKALRQPGFKKSRTSIAVIDIESGAMLASHMPDLALNPASCMKILTTATALSSLGPDYRFRTDFLADRHPRNGSIGTLYVSGTGDPYLVNEVLWRIARNLYDIGLRRVTNGIVIDDSYFDSHDFPRKAGNSYRAYAAKTSAVSINFNAFTIHLAPGERSGLPAVVNIEPPVEYFRVINKLKTGRKYHVKVTSIPANGHETITISGHIPTRFTGGTIRRSVANPIQYAGAVIRYIFAQNGIEVAGQIREGDVPAGAVGLVSEESEPLGIIVRSMNKFSNNFMAEQVLKHLGAARFGRPGSTSKGLRVIRDYLQSIGLPQDSYVIENGSGLSAKTRLSAEQLARILSAVYLDFTIRPEFISSLPIVGVDGTTKKWKFADSIRGMARAKTGTLGGVSTLAGYVPLKNGRIAAFAILANGLPKGADAAHRAQLMVLKTISEASP